MQLGQVRRTWSAARDAVRRVAQEVAAQPLPPGQERRDEVGAVEVGQEPHAPAARRPAHAGAVAEHQVGPGEQVAIGRVLDGDVEGVGVDEEQRGRLGRGHQRGELGQGRLDGLVHHLDAEDPDRGGLRAGACRAEPGQERRADPGDVEQQHGSAVDAGTEQDGEHQARKGGRQGGRLDGQGHDRGGERHPERLGHGKADREHAARRGGRQDQRRALRGEGCGQGAGEAPDRDQERVEDQARHGRGCEQPDEQVGAVGEVEGMAEIVGHEALDQGERRDPGQDGGDPGPVVRADHHRGQRLGDAGEADGRRHGQRQECGGVVQQLLARGRRALPLEPVDGQRKGGEGHRHEQQRDRPVDHAERHGVDGDRVRAGQPLEEQPVAVRDHRTQGVAQDERGGEPRDLAQDRGLAA